MREDTKNQKIIASVVIIVAVALIAVAASAFNKKDSKDESSTSQTAQASQSTSTPEVAQNETTTTTPSTGDFKDGSYSASGKYVSPGGTEIVAISLTLKDGAVTAVDTKMTADNDESREYHSRFLGEYKSKVVGKKLSSLNLSRVSGASLTTGGFNEVLEQIETKAKA